MKKKLGSITKNLILAFCLVFVSMLTFFYHSIDTSELIISLSSQYKGEVNSITLNGLSLQNQTLPIMPGEKAMFEAKLIRGNNIIDFDVLTRDSGLYQKYTCELKKINRRCIAEIYLSDSGIKCFDCIID